MAIRRWRRVTRDPEHGELLEAVTVWESETRPVLHEVRRSWISGNFQERKCLTVCVEEWEAMTGIVIEPGQCVRVELSGRKLTVPGTQELAK